MKGLDVWPDPPPPPPGPRVINHTLFVGDTGVAFTVATNFVYHLMTRAISRTEYLTVIVPSWRGLTDDHLNRIKYLKGKGVAVATHVQLSRLEHHLVVQRHVYRNIFFHFPTTFTDHDPQWLPKKVLAFRGCIHVTLAEKPIPSRHDRLRRYYPYTREVVNIANNSKLKLRDIVAFTKDHDYTMKTSGDFGGIQSEITVEGAATLVFSRSTYVNIPILDTETVLDRNPQEFFISSVRELYDSLSEKKNVPHTQLVYGLDTAARSSFSSVETIFVPNLLMCTYGIGPTNFSPCVPPWNKGREFNMCETCMSAVILRFEKSESMAITTSLVTCICCTHHFEANLNPLIHLVTYFNSSQTDLLEEADEYNITNVLAIYASCNLTITENCSFYTDVEITQATEGAFIADINKENFEIGRIIQFTLHDKPHYAAILNLELLSEIKFHIMDHRILISNTAHFCLRNLRGEVLDVYRSSSLYPAFYTREFSVWVKIRDFEEKLLMILIWNLAGSVVNKVSLVSEYLPHVPNIVKERRTYDIVYQSLERVLPNFIVDKIHSYVAKSIKAYLKKLGWLSRPSRLL
ncbi:FDX-ACB domain-containing protein [Caerostris extrusa]|uniref:FDX-ACB domain-containing protein n=1 Tax=Caerostris extrusa TaxID=172846 RepID=A0AAV4Y5Q8_CAEEX|nr:FDX-ACB domain-containing protein [Caerostris extrusa]